MTDMTDEDVLAELSEDERFPFRFGIRQGERVELFRRLAQARRQLREAEARASGRTMYDAAEVERERIASEVDNLVAAFDRQGDEAMKSTVDHVRQSAGVDYAKASMLRALVARLRAVTP